MPIYEYKCLEHGKFNLVQVPMSESELSKPCPECGEMAKRIFSTFNSGYIWVLDNIDKFQDDLPRRDI